ncbi:hypothetical protein Forpe1208_v010798 [Fusarium oxysporum f. sp. rapae]|uniref:Uncharacterized protein n=1 Tax=Fusarium oxysporum f. sp. rapae TaxID=485398 RepID=A0A8J5TQI7_FUSOX|nr:hypothetical protein Forpe1208_v010798 [Fusarium oxysporum f. sp. rapae]
MHVVAGSKRLPHTIRAIYVLTMRIPFIIGLALVATSQACDKYKYCHCTNADGTPNDGATFRSCPSDRIKFVEKGYAECEHYENFVFAIKAIDNCNFRKACNHNGAPGDSNCRAKVGIFKA